MAMSSPPAGGERLAARPSREHFGAEGPRHPDARLQDAFPDRQRPGPAPEGILATELMNRRLNQDPA